MTFNVRTFLLTVLFAAAAATGLAQQVTLTMGTGNGAPGAVATVNLTMASTGGAQAAGLQWTLTPGAGISSVTFTPSASATAAGKSVSCSPNGASIACVLFGLNTNLLTDGVVATAAVTISPTTTLTNAALAMSATVASTAAGDTIPSTGVSGVVTITQVAPTYALSGTVSGGAGATIALTGAASKTTTADASGNYSFSGLANGTYTVTPTKPGYNVSPASQSVTINNANGTANFAATQQTWSITGAISGGAGASVALSGTASKTTTADASGNYAFTGLVNGSYTVAPTKAGYTLSPANQAVTINNSSATANFTATAQTWSITGTISGGSGATVNLTGAASKSATADTNGNYSFTGLVNGSYTVTPTKVGYDMSPTSQAVTINNGNGTASFTATQQPLGQVSLSMGTGAGTPGTVVNVDLSITSSSGAQPTGVQWRLTPGAAISAVTFTASTAATNAGKTLTCSTSNGNTDCILVGMNTTVLPNGPVATAAITISPTTAAASAALTLSNIVVSNAAGTSIPSTSTNGVVNIIQPAPTYTLSGVISGGAGATVALSGAASKTATADASGNYSFAGLANGAYTVAPTKSGYNMSPASQSVSINNANATANFTATAQTWTISGNISGGAGSTVTLTGAASKTTTADASGNYSFATLANGSYTVTPTKSGYTFTPVNKAVTISGANQTVNFAATAQTWGISGIVSGTAATMTLTGPVNLTASTDANGNYSFAGLVNGSYTLTPSASGFTFSPVNKAITINGANQTGINFTATQAQTWSISGTITGGAGASVALTGAASQTTTADASGNYTFSGLANGTYTITPTLANSTMTPTSRSVTVNSANLTGANFTATASTTSATPSIDATVSRDYTSAVPSFTSPTFSTQAANELLLAFISTDNARNTQTIRSVSGGRLNWRLGVRTNRQGGTSEIWYAFAARQLSSVSVGANLAQKAAGQITVMAFSNIDTSNSGSGAIGAAASANGASGAPYAPLTPTRAGSIVLGVGNDPISGIARVPLSGQSLTHQLLISGQGTAWVQKFDTAVITAGVQMVLGDSAPTGSSYNYSAIEIRGPIATAPVLSSPGTGTTTTSNGGGKKKDLADAAPAPGTVALVHPVTYQPADVCSPGGLATLLGTSFTTQTPQSVLNASLPTQLAGVQVQVNGQYAKLLMASAEQIHFLCPDLPAGTPLDIEVVSENGKLQRAPLSTMRAAEPAVFTVPNSTQAVLQLANSDPQQDGQAVHRGDTIRLYPASLGAVTSPITVGEAAPADRQILLQNSLKVVINGTEIDPAFAGLAAGTVGLYQVDVRIPADAPISSDVPFTLKLRLPDGTEILSNPATIAIGSDALRGRR